MRFVVGLILCCLGVASVSGFSPSELHLRGQFAQFKSVHGKNYSTLSEHEQRFVYFQQNMAEAAKLNVKIPTATFGETKFSDLHPEEFARQYLGFKKRRSHAILNLASVMAPLDVDSAPTSVDWTALGYTTPVKNQGSCGSCWAQSTAQAIESAWAAAHGLTGNGGVNIPLLSVQQLVDCDTVDQGCNGGDTTSGYQFVQQNNGLVLDSAYPYTAGDGQSGTCLNSSQIAASITGFTYVIPPCQDACSSQDESLMAANVAGTGPASVCLNAAGNGGSVWQLYKSGVLTDVSSCPGASSDLDHCVLLTGYGTDQDGTDYWSIKNSWGTDWGQDGYILLKRGVNMCGVADEATFATSA